MPSSKGKKHSKGRKHSKTQSRLSNSDNISSPGSLDFEATEEILSKSLEQASIKYPSLIGNSAFIGRVTDVRDDLKSSEIWLSEPSMVASSFFPGSIVSVSLPCLKSGFSDGFPLSSLADEFARCFGVDSCGQLTNDAGNYFALATILPSSEVKDNGVLLSSNISNTLGCPPSGRDIFIHCVQNQSRAGRLCDTTKALSTKVNCLSVYECKELVLEQLYSTNESSVDSFGTEGDDSAKRVLQTCAATWLYSRCLIGGNFVTIPFLPGLCLFRVIGAKTLSKNNANDDLLNEAPELVGGENDAFLVVRETKVCVHLPSSPQGCNLSSVECNESIADTGDSIPRLGGLSKEYAVLKDFIISSSRNDSLRFGLTPRKGVILHGPPGTGKTSLARLCGRDSGFKFFSVNAHDSEQALLEVFHSAFEAAPSVVFIDNIDLIGEIGIVSTLLHLMDGIGSQEVVVIAATNRLDSIYPALRGAGRLEKAIEIGVPSPNQRLEILRFLVGATDHSVSDEQFQDLAYAARAFVGADLAALCAGASLNCLERYLEFKCSKDTTHVSGDYSDSTSSSVSHLRGTIANGDNFLNGIEEEFVLKVTFEDFEKARMSVQPSFTREFKEIRKVNWEDVGGQREIKNQLMEAVMWLNKPPEELKQMGFRPQNGVLMFGPTGCGKTLMAHAVASETWLNCLAVKGHELLGCRVGESEKTVKSLFAKARALAPAIIFIDDFDSLAAKDSVSDRVLRELIVEMEGLNARFDATLTVIAATNRLDMVSSALLKPGCFDWLLNVGPPNEPDREEIFRIHLRKIPCSSDVDICELAHLSEGCTGADISLICRQAGFAALKESLDASEVKMELFKTAIKQVKESLDASEVKMELFKTAIKQVKARKAWYVEKLSEKFQGLIESSTNENQAI